MVAHEKRNPAQLFCAVPTQNDLALSSLLFSDHPTQKLEYPGDRVFRIWRFGRVRIHFAGLGAGAVVPARRYPEQGHSVKQRVKRAGGHSACKREGKI